MAAAPSPSAPAEVHHTKHKANGGTTSVKDCVLLCPFHHQIVIHRWGWTLVVNPDGTTSAWNKNKTKVLHSHGPPLPAPGRAARLVPPGLPRLLFMGSPRRRECLRYQPPVDSLPDDGGLRDPIGPCLRQAGPLSQCHATFVPTNKENQSHD